MDCMIRRPSTPFRNGAVEPAPRRRSTYPRARRSDEDYTRSTSRASSRSTVDSWLTEDFSGSDLDPSAKATRSSKSEVGSMVSISDPAENPAAHAQQLQAHAREARSWISGLKKRLVRSATKRVARNLLDDLVDANDERDGKATARRRRFQAAAGLIDIIENEPEGQSIVARRIIKGELRQDGSIEAVLRLSDDELDEFGYGAVSPISEMCASQKLLDAVVKHTTDSSFFRTTIPRLLKDGKKGTAAILYLATKETGNFLLHVKDTLILNFCVRVVTTEEILRPKWYCGAKLFCLLLIQPLSIRGRPAFGLMMTKLLSSVCKPLIHRVTAELEWNTSRTFQKDSISIRLRILPLVAGCCNSMRHHGNWSTLPPACAQILNPFAEQLINFVHYENDDSLLRNTESGYALSIILSLIERESPASSISQTSLAKLAAELMSTVLHKRAFEVQKPDIFAKVRETGVITLPIFAPTNHHVKVIIKSLNATLDDSCVTALCRLPESISSDALASALNQAKPKLNSPGARNIYEPLALVESLLWLSNQNADADIFGQVHRILIKGDACTFLGQVISSSNGGLDPEDRGLWRVKGLAMTCIGNIIERMGEEEIHDHVPKDVIDSVVAIKENGTTPLVQKGQAIFMLQRYTLTADRWHVNPYYRENTSNMD